MGIGGCFMAVTREEFNDIRANPEALQERLENEELRDREFDVDKAWDGIHFLLAGVKLGQVAVGVPPLFGDAEVEGTDFGYSPLYFLTPEQLKDALEWMRAHAPEDMRARYDAAAFEKADIYPEIWGREDDNAIDYLIDNYIELIAYYDKAAKAGDAMLFWLG
jgi:hypothetical protein